MQKKNTPTGLVRKSIYDDLRVSIPCALLAGQSITAYHQKENFFELFLLWPYYPAILFSMLMAWIIFYVINRGDRYLQKILPWDRQPTLRLLVQGVLCSLFPLVLDFIALAAYYSIVHELSVYKSVFFKVYLFPIFLYTVMINMYYNCRYIAMAQGFIVIDPNEQSEHGDTSESVRLEAEMKLNEEIRAYAEENDIAYIKTKEGMYLAKNSLGEDRHWKHNITISGAALPPELFYKVSRGSLVRRDSIERLIENPANHQVTVVLKETFNHEKHDVSVDNTLHFKNWYKNPPVKEE